MRRPTAGRTSAPALSLALLGLLAAARGAQAAAGEDEWQLSARLGVGAVDADGRSPFGGVVGADVEYGLTDAWAAHLSTTLGFHPVDAQMANMDTMKPMLPGGTVRTVAASAGVTYTFDVLRLVPYMETGIGILALGGAVRKPGVTFSAELGVGADYLLTKRWALGGLLQYQFTPLNLFGSAMDLGGTSYDFALSVRLSRLF